MRLSKQSFVPVSLLVLILLAASVIPAFAAPIDVWVPCANEIVPMDGNIQSSFATMVGPDGITYSRTLQTRRETTGVGPRTGDMYYGGGSGLTKQFAQAGPWGPAGTIALVQDVWKIESDNVVVTRTYTFQKDQRGVVVVNSTTYSCTPK